MYRIVDKAVCRKYRSDCSAVLKKVCALLKEKGISAQFALVGSGARNMVTRNGDGPFDLDYNLEIVKAPEEYRSDLRHLKDTIRVLLDRAACQKYFSKSQDSTSCLTALLHSKDEPEIEFSFDVAVVTRNSKGNFCRLIHNKNALGFGADQYVWNEIADSHDVAQKARRLKSEGLWLDVRNRYIERKNVYLSHQRDKDHPSFVVYVEVVNETHHKYFE